MATLPPPDATADAPVVATPGAGPAPTAAPAPTAMSATSVRAGYEDRVALSDVSFAIPAGTLVAIVGPNGGGKTTLLKLAAGILRPWSGSLTVLGGPPGREARRVAYVPQAELVDWSFPVSVWDVAMMGRFPRLGPVRRPRREDRDAVLAALERVGMEGRARTQIGSLSGGQRRRAFLARAIAADPDLYLLDEPVTGVDVTTQEDLMALLRAETVAGKTVVATTHDLPAAAEHFDTVIGVNRTITVIGPAESVLDPETLARTYGGHLLVLGTGRAVVLDDAHHHDAASGHERHFHEGGRG